VNQIDALSDLVVQSGKIVVFTGAGISTESGIPDFRSPGGIWDKFDPNEFTYQRFLSSEANRENYWQFSRDFWPAIVNAQPNPGHYAIAELYKLGKLDCVITQNVDGLHQESGLPEDSVIELHGTARWVNCLQCGKRYPRQEIQDRVETGEKVPACDTCAGMLKPATVSFGQPMPERETREAEVRSSACDLFLVAGSSLVVYPAAQMPLIAKRSGARLIIVNLAATPHDGYADVVINEKIGSTLSRMVDVVKSRMEK